MPFLLFVHLDKLCSYHILLAKGCAYRPIAANLLEEGTQDNDGSRLLNPSSSVALEFAPVK